MQYRPPRAPFRTHRGPDELYHSEGRVLYVGKAKLAATAYPTIGRTRPSCCPGRPRWWPRPIMSSGSVVDSEVDALILEHSRTQAQLPRYNVRLKDDKSYPWLAITLNEEWLRPAVVRGATQGVRYFGPDGHADAICQTLDLLIRSCRSARAGRRSSNGTSVWAGPACSTTSTAARVPASARWTTRRTTVTLNDLMALSLGRHRAGAGQPGGGHALPPRTGSSSSGRRGCGTGSPPCTRRPRPQQMVSDRAEDFDVIGVAEDPLEAAVQIFRGMLWSRVGNWGFVAEKVEDFSSLRIRGGRSSRRSTATRAPRYPAGSLYPNCRLDRETARELALRRPGGSGRLRRAAPRSETGPPGDRDPLGQRGPGPAPAAPGLGPQRTFGALYGAPECASGCGKPPCASSATT